MLQNTDDSQKYDDNDDVGDELDAGESYLYQTRSIFYSTLSLWDILVDCSNVTERAEDNAQLSLNEKRVSSMICNLDELLSKFNAFILNEGVSSINIENGGVNYETAPVVNITQRTGSGASILLKSSDFQIISYS